MADQMTTTIYRKSTLGICLSDALDELVAKEEISETLSLEVLQQFDESFNEAFSKIRNKATFKSCPIESYRFLENCWTFVLKNPTIRLDSETITCPALKIVATDDEKVNAKDEEK